MIPITSLIALLIAFGIEPPLPGVPGAEVRIRVFETAGGVIFVAGLAVALGWSVAARVARAGYGSSTLRKRYALGLRALAVLSLIVYAWIVHSVGWPRLIRANGGSATSCWSMIS
jgi:hypothetical protein